MRRTKGDSILARYIESGNGWHTKDSCANHRINPCHSTVVMRLSNTPMSPSYHCFASSVASSCVSGRARATCLLVLPPRNRCHFFLRCGNTGDNSINVQYHPTPLPPIPVENPGFFSFFARGSDEAATRTKWATVT